MIPSKTWAIIENAGYERECLVRSGLTSYLAADRLMHKLYSGDEIDDLHVDIALEGPHGGWTYDY